MTDRSTYRGYSKREWRTQIRERIAQKPQASLVAESEAVLRLLEESPVFAQAHTVAAYWSLPGEVCTHDFVVRWSSHKQILLPVMQGEGLILRPFRGVEGLVKRRFGVLEPMPESGAGSVSTSSEEGEEGDLCPAVNLPAFDPAPDLILVPGVAFDPRGHRLGHGKGFYDRLLLALKTRHPTCKIIGICFDVQLVDLLPAEEHDIPMDAVLCLSRKNSYLCRTPPTADPTPIA